MKRPAIFFDRDNTLIITDGYLGDPSQVRLLDGASNALARARKLGYAIIVFSNQSGVARGMFSEDDVRAVNARLDMILRSENSGAIIDRHEFCPYHPQAPMEAYRRDSDLRKPQPGMIYTAAQTLELDLATSWVVGDAPRDIEAGQIAGCRTILLRDPSLPQSAAARERMKAPPEVIVKSLMEAIDYIERNPEKPPPTTPAAPEVEPTQSFTPAESKSPPPPPEAQRTIMPASATIAPTTTRLESLTEQILQEFRRRNEQPEADFSVSKLLAGIAQVISIAVAFIGYLNRNNDASYLSTMILAVWVQCLTIALLVMGKQKQG